MAFHLSTSVVAATVVAVTGALSFAHAQTQQPGSTKLNQPKQAPVQNAQLAQCTTEVARLAEFNKRLQERLTGFSEQADKQIADERTKAETCARDLAAVNSPSLQGSDADLRLEIVKLRGQLAALQQENQKLGAQAVALTSAALPCAAVNSGVRASQSIVMRVCVAEVVTRAC